MIQTFIGCIFSFLPLAQIMPVEVLEKIASLQVKSDQFYDKGSFKNQRYLIAESSAVEDNSILFSASIACILSSLPEIESQNQIINQIKTNFKNYQSRNGEVTYNFWKTSSPDLPFPNGPDFLVKKKYRFPDDLNTTLMIYLSLNDSIKSKAFRNKMLEYASRKERKEVIETPFAYRKFNAYESLFADKMNQEYDLTIMANTLYFVFKNGYSLSYHDKQSIEFIKKAINEKAYLEMPELIAPSIQNSSSILYHLARMIALDHKGIFELEKKKLINDINSLLKTELNHVEKVVLQTSLFKLGEKTTPIDISIEAYEGDAQSHIHWHYKVFKQDELDILPTYKWKCEALSWVYLYEYLILRN